MRGHDGSGGGGWSRLAHKWSCKSLAQKAKNDCYAQNLSMKSVR